MATVAKNITDIGAHRARPLAEGMERLTQMLRAACPADAMIHFDFRDRLRVLIDVRSLEDVMTVESMLSVTAPGTFHSIKRTTVPGHSFLKRVTAFVEA